MEYVTSTYDEIICQLIRNNHELWLNIIYVALSCVFNE